MLNQVGALLLTRILHNPEIIHFSLAATMLERGAAFISSILRWQEQSPLSSLLGRASTAPQCPVVLASSVE